MRPYQSGPRVRAAELPELLWRGRYRACDWIRPQYKRLAMGSSHAVFLLMCINRMMLRRVGDILFDRVIIRLTNNAQWYRSGIV